MTKNQFRKKYRELVKTTAKDLIERGEKALKCGGFEIESYTDDFILPKIVITAAIENAKYNFRPLLSEHRAVVKNLTYFI